MLLFIELFIVIFILVLLLYELIVFRKYKSKKKSRRKKKEYPMELLILKNFYKVEVEKLSFNKMLHVLAVVSSFDIALIVSIVGLIDNGILQIILAMILVLPIIFSSYYLVSLFCKIKIKEKAK